MCQWMIRGWVIFNDESNFSGNQAWTVAHISQFRSIVRVMWFIQTEKLLKYVFCIIGLRSALLRFLWFFTKILFKSSTNWNLSHRQKYRKATVVREKLLRMTLEELVQHGQKIKKLIKKERFDEANNILGILNGKW